MLATQLPRGWRAKTLPSSRLISPTTSRARPSKSKKPKPSSSLARLSKTVVRTHTIFWPRAIMTMFVITEVHPFIDGNGRTARLAMNCMLSAQKFSRIIVPTVYREDYLLPLKALSHNKAAEPLLVASSRVQRWSAAFDYSVPRPELRASLARCNAFQEDLRNYKLLFPSRPEL